MKPYATTPNPSTAAAVEGSREALSHVDAFEF